MRVSPGGSIVVRVIMMGVLMVVVLMLVIATMIVVTKIVVAMIVMRCVRVVARRHGGANGKPMLFPDDPAIVGIATDAELKTTLPVVPLDDIPAIAAMMKRSALPVEDVLARSVTES